MTQETIHPSYVAQCDSCDVTAELSAATPVTEVELLTFLAAHADCERFSVTISIARS